MRHLLPQAIAGALLLELVLFASACPPPTPADDPEPPPPRYEPDAGATCASVCSHWAELGCPEADDSPGGESCEAVCTRVQESGIIEWNLACRAAINDCGQVDSCEE